jgi:predicted ferric reductase
MTTTLNSQLPWMASRACGFGAFVCFSAVAMLGLLAASGILRRAGSKRKPDVAAYHRVLALIGWPLIAAHALLLLADPWLHATLAQLAWPFRLHLGAAFWAGLAAPATAALAATSVTPWLQRRVRRVPGQRIHRVTSVAAYVLLSAHVLGAGTDVRRGIVHFAVVQAVALTALVFVARVVVPRLPARAASA